MNILLTKNDAGVLHTVYGQINKIGIIGAENVTKFTCTY